MKKIFKAEYWLFALLIGLFQNCERNSNDSAYESLKLISSYELDVPEPSGLSFTAGQVALYTVSDQTNKIYKISFQGKLLSTINCEGTDLEGICFNSLENNIWVVEERTRSLLNTDLQGNTLQRISLDISAQDENKGLEGITLNAANGHFFCVNEANPGLLIELDENQQIINETVLNFAADYSGIFYDNETDNLWIVSDESSTITRCDLKGTTEKTYHLGINKAEGIVVDSKNNLVYVVSDSAEKLYVFGL